MRESKYMYSFENIPVYGELALHCKKTKILAHILCSVYNTYIKRTRNIKQLYLVVLL